MAIQHIDVQSMLYTFTSKKDIFHDNEIDQNTATTVSHSDM